MDAIQDFLFSEGIRHIRIDGGISMHARNDLVHKFQEDDIVSSFFVVVVVFNVDDDDASAGACYSLLFLLL